MPDRQDTRDATGRAGRAGEGDPAGEAGGPMQAGVGARPTRRRVLRRVLAGGALAGLGAAGYAWRIEPVWPEFVCQPMPIAGLPPELAGFRIVQVSDLHVGARVPLDYLAKWVEWVSQRQADLVVVTGDLVHYGAAEWTDAAARLLARLGARQQLLAVLGNHDWGTSVIGQGVELCAARVVGAMTAQGVRLLNNERVVIERGSARLHVVGLDDYWGNRFDPAAAFAEVPASAACIALSHNPDSFPELLDTPASWVLSGHTHGGQVNLPLIGPPIVPVRHKQFVAGHYRLGGRNLYVNRGLGWLVRVRFNARPEITEFMLERA